MTYLNACAKAHLLTIDTETSFHLYLYTYTLYIYKIIKFIKIWFYIYIFNIYILKTLILRKILKIYICVIIPADLVTVI